MSLVFMEGFDTYNDYLAMSRSDRWQSVGSRATFPAGRTGGRSMDIGFAITARTRFETTDTSLVYGFACYIASRGGADMSWFVKIRGADYEGMILVGIMPTAYGDMFEVRNENGDILGTFNVPIDMWVYIEVKATFHPTAGSVVVNVNQIEEVNVTGVDTVSNASTTNVPLYLDIYEQSSSGSTVYIDDMYICDTLGSKNNDFLGDVLIETLLPTGDDTVQWTKSAGANNFENVDEYPDPDDDSTYNYSSTAAQKDLLTFEDLAATPSDIYAVAIGSVIAKQGTGLASFTHHINTGANANESVPTGFFDDTYRHIHHFEEFQTGSTEWDEAAVNAIKAGYEVL